MMSEEEYDVGVSDLEDARKSLEILKQAQIG